MLPILLFTGSMLWLASQETKPVSGIGSTNSYIQIRSELINWSAKNLIGKFVYKTELNAPVYIRRKHLRHAASTHHGYPEVEIKALYKIIPILHNAVYSKFDENNKPSDPTKGVHNFVGIEMIEGRIYTIWVKVKDINNEWVVYDIGVMK